MNFPKDFLWGTAVSAHQTEGNNTNSDWWHWEVYKDLGRQFPLESSGIACDSYNRYEEDFDLCQKLNNNAIRLSIEWARIEPREGFYDERALQHYKKVLNAARSRGLKTFVTLHHFTNPIWFTKKGGFLNLKSPEIFSRYAKVCAQELGHLCDVMLTINEPQVYALMSYTTGVWPPNKKNLFYSLIVQINLMRVHIRSYLKIKQVDKNIPVGIVKNIVWYDTDPVQSKFADKIIAKFIYFMNADFFLRPIIKKCDLIGLNYYFTNRIVGLKRKNADDFVSDLGWWIYPIGLKNVLLDLKKYNIPIYITENGVADSNDTIRESFVFQMLEKAYEAIKEGVNLKGYFYWSLIDNYEWHHGFWPRFGLVEIDRNDNLKRKMRKSSEFYSEICKTNSLIEPKIKVKIGKA